MPIDIKLTDSGDLVLSENGDLELVYGDEQIAQEVIFRLKTTKGDWVLSPNIGASLEEFIGSPNIPITHSLIEVRVFNALTFDFLLVSPEVSVIPITETEVLIVVEFLSQENDNRVIQVQSGLDLNKGLVFARTDTRSLQ